MNKSVIYWKWENSTLNGDLVDKIDDLCSRMGMGTVFIGLHWIELPYYDEKLQAAIALCAEELHKRGVKLVVEACPRNEGATFFERYPDEVAYLTTSTEIALDANGKGSIAVDTTPIPHYWRMKKDTPNRMIAAFLFEKSADGELIPESVSRIDSLVTISPDGANSTVVTVDSGEIGAGKYASVFVGIPQPMTDVASDHFGEFYEYILETVKHAKVDGVMSDEWGYDVIIGMEDQPEEPDYYKKRELFFKHITYSDNFARRYKTLCGRDLTDDLLVMYYPENDRRENIKTVNMYHKTMRDIMRRNDEVMYSLAKKVLGPDTFYGVHPTWWGNNYLQNFEGFKNGFYWWEARRDVAQTDEIVIMPIRTALAHKWGGNVWYNMWYSMGTRDIRTYFRDTWASVRYTGRTHYLSYECPNEAVVLELKPKGLLEQIEEMDKIVRSVDDCQNSMPDSRVLVLFGMENSLNWYYNDPVTPPWIPRHKVLSAVLETADRIFDDYLCDLVPTSEIENGSLNVFGGKAHYGSQEYDAVILLGCDSMAPECYSFLDKLDASPIAVAGEASVFSDGSPIGDAERALLDRATKISGIEAHGEIKELLGSWGIKKNRYPNGCVLQDGSVMFTCEGEMASHNPLTVDAVYGGEHISFVGEDMLYLENRMGELIPHYTNGELTIKKA